jgi:hypothetical protein
MFPHERSLVQRYRGRPFVLLGVNADEDVARLRRTQQEAGLTWPCWHDGPGGKIGQAWQVDGLPAFFLIDQRGVVRWRHFGRVDPHELERHIDEALGV